MIHKHIYTQANWSVYTAQMFGYLSYTTSILKFMHLGKHNYFLCLVVSKFLLSNPNNVNLESEDKYMSCQIMSTSKQFPIVFLSGNNIK